MHQPYSFDFCFVSSYEWVSNWLCDVPENFSFTWAADMHVKPTVMTWKQFWLMHRRRLWKSNSGWYLVTLALCHTPAQYVSYLRNGYTGSTRRKVGFTVQQERGFGLLLLSSLHFFFFLHYETYFSQVKSQFRHFIVEPLRWLSGYYRAQLLTRNVTTVAGFDGSHISMEPKC